MTRLDPQVFAQIKREVPIEWLLRRYGGRPTVRGGSFSGWHSMRCPFHKGGMEQHPSARFSVAKNRFNCFACDVGGTVIDVAMYAEGFSSPRDAAEWLLRTYRRT